MISNQQKLFIRWKASDNMPKKSRRIRKLEKHSYKEKYENYRARIDSESAPIFASEEERIAAVKANEEKWKKIDEYGKKLYGKDWLGDKK